jgi:formamidopyrimidine-DNA glycosylase
MPELPEVETVRRSLLPGLVGRRIESVEVRERRLRSRIDPAALRRQLHGRRVEDLSRRGKYLLLHVEGGRRLVIHLGMSGRLLLTEGSAPLEAHVHVRFRLDNGFELRFRDHRRFGLVEVNDAAALAADPRLAGLGVEPLSRSCTARRLQACARARKRPIKSFLMDARQIAGVGNIYASEALFLAGIHPRRAAGRLSYPAWRRLTKALKKVLREAIRQGGTTLNDFQNANGEAGYFQVYLRVYGRAGEPCFACGGRIRRQVLAGRSTFYCPGCQR